MRPMLGCTITLIAILLSESWSLPDLICYEPTSGQGPALDSWACKSIGVDIIDHWPFHYLYLTHSMPPWPYFIHCPLELERNGCLFKMDFFSPTETVKVARSMIYSAIIDIDSHCVGREVNVDGGQLVENFGDRIFLTYSLGHPRPRLTGMNTSTGGNSQPNENSVVPAHLNASLVGSGDDNSSYFAFDR